MIEMLEGRSMYAGKDARGKPFGGWVGESTFRTAAWVGHFERTWMIEGGMPFVEFKRGAITKHICPGNKGDSAVRGALIDRYGGDGGKRAAVGLKATPGPLYGVKKDVWSALALVVMYAEKRASDGADGDLRNRTGKGT